MIYEFKCRATGPLIMTGDVGEIILRAINHEPGPKGVITVEQMPQAIKQLQALSDANQEIPENTEQDDDASEPVSLSQRAFPFIEMLERALSAGKDITWGV